MKIVFTWDDGAPEDKRLFALHEKYALPAIFFVPTRNSEGRTVLSAEDIRAASSELLQFGGHTTNHRYLTKVPREEWDAEIVGNKRYLEDTLARPVSHFAFPGGAYDKEILAETYRHFRTIRAGDTMNFHNQGTLIKPTFHIYPRGKKSLLGNAWRHKGMKEFAFLLKHMDSDYFLLIERLIDFEARHSPDSEIVFLGHGWELEEQGMWNRAERLLQLVAEQYRECCVTYNSLFEN